MLVPLLSFLLYTNSYELGNVYTGEAPLDKNFEVCFLPYSIPLDRAEVYQPGYTQR
ncbi:unnamed protein product, partial [marine sediment metagenome]